MKTVCGGTALRRSDPDGVIIDNRSLRSRATHIPDTGLRLSIDPSANTFRLAELIRHGNVMPVFSGRKPTLRCPAMPLLTGLWLATHRHRRKKETDASFALRLAHTQSPVLIVGRKTAGPRPSLSDHIHVFAGPQRIDLHPRFERHCIAVCKVKRTLHPGIVERKVRTLAVQFDGRIVGRKIRILRRSRPRRVALHAAMRFQRRGFFLFKIPTHNRC